MAYKLGQVRKSSSVSYLSDVNYRAAAITTAGYAKKQFKDYAIAVNNGSFTSDKSYYLRFRIKRIAINDSRFNNYIITNDINDPRSLAFKLELFADDGSTTGGEYEKGTYQIINSTITVEPYIEGVNTEYFSYDIMFTPTNTYKYLGFILSRTNYDYLQSISRDDIATSINLETYGDVSVVNNILPIENAIKIGIQTKPGSLICINHEPIRVGRSGVYEVNNGILINFVGFSAPNGSINTNVHDFILDYAYDG